MGDFFGKEKSMDNVEMFNSARSEVSAEQRELLNAKFLKIFCTVPCAPSVTTRIRVLSNRSSCEIDQIMSINL